MTRRPGGIRTFLIADIRGYTRFTAEHGDEAAASLAARFADTTANAVENRDGELVELRGDEALAVFDSVRQALRAAVELQSRFIEETRLDPSRPLVVGMGLDAGEAVAVGDGYRGAALNTAARLCALAAGGEIVASQGLVHLAGAVPGVAFVELGPRELKGMKQAVTAVRVEATDASLGAERSAGPIRVVLADDALLLREALAAGLKAAGFEVVGQASDVAGLLGLVESQAPDVAVVDVRMPPTHTTEGLEAAREIRRSHPGIAILVLSQYVETRYAIDLIRDGPSGVGYLLKDRVTRLEDLSDAVRRVAAGGSVIDPEVVGRLLGRPRRHSPLDELTPREREILGLMAEGRSNQGIAAQLVLELKTVEGHVGQIFNKLGLEPSTGEHRRVLAVLLMLRDE
jgi:DNA-binding NarL/FixJ family response regulator/class 3 adenylate cyclase